ncbi:MAG: flippase-like domain-containing protein [Chloroflexi bacterium]|nr:flippase-like domain-containing protein [Chloroflexota bacterium]
MTERDRPQGGATGLALGRRVLSLPTLVSFAVAVALVAFLLTRFRVDLSSTWDTVRQSNLALYLLAVAVHYLTFVFRGARWRLLLANAKDGPAESPAARVSALHCGQLILLSWFVNCISWFRVGDAYRGYAYTEDTGSPFSRTMGTILAERVLDVVMVVILVSLAALVLYLEGTGPAPIFLAMALAMLAVSVAALVAMRLVRARLAHLLPERLERAYHRFHQGTMGSFRRLHWVFLLGALAWVCEVGRLYLVVQAVGLPVGVGLLLFVPLANALLTTIPLTPGGLGIVETGITGLLMLALGREEAVAVALVDRSISYLSIVVVGGALFAARHLSRARRSRGRPYPVTGAE